MTFVQARNAIVAGLEAHIGCPVNLSEQIADIPEFPYCYYSVLAPRIPKYSFGLREIIETAGEPQLIRSEQVLATMSFTFAVRIEKPITDTSLVRMKPSNSQKRRMAFSCSTLTTSKPNTERLL